jgi:type 1 glutamine amidotransferase
MAFKKIVFHVGGAYHPTEEQAAAIIDWLGAGYTAQVHDGVAAFEALDDADLFVVMGMHWSGMVPAMISDRPYHPPGTAHKIAFERYVASGRPLLVHHAGIFSYDDWPRFGELLGFQWHWDLTSYVPVTEYVVKVEPTGHPLMAGVEDYAIVDEIYVDVQITPGLNPEVHAAAHIQDDRATRSNGHSTTRSLPLVFTAEGGRVSGAGRLVYLMNGHDMQAFECPALRQMWINAVNWLTQE